MTCPAHCPAPPATHPATGAPGPGAVALAAARCAALDAKTVLGGAAGEVIHDWLMDWAEIGWRYDNRGRGLALTADIQRRMRAHVLGMAQDTAVNG